MTITSRLMTSGIAAIALTVGGLISTNALAEKIKDSGSVEMAYVKHCGQSIPDQSDHRFGFNEGEGISTNKGGLIDGFSVRV
jgi:hypothetical protein